MKRMFTLAKMILLLIMLPLVVIIIGNPRPIFAVPLVYSSFEHLSYHNQYVLTTQNQLETFSRSKSVEIPLFDATWGELQAVELWIETTLRHNCAAKNSTATNQLVQFFETTTFGFNLLLPPISETQIRSSSLFHTLERDFYVDHDTFIQQPSNDNYWGFTSTVYSSLGKYQILTGSDVTPFIGDGFFYFQVLSDSELSFTSSSDLVSLLYDVGLSHYNNFIKIKYFFDGEPPTPTPIPEPSSILLMGAGLIGLVGFRKKFKE